jgi:hypothetical protein
MSNKCIICQVGELKRSNQKYCSRHCILFSKRGKNEKYRLTENGKEALKRGRLKYNRTNKIKVQVRETTHHWNKKEGICLICGFVGNTEFNHMSYQPSIFFEVCKGCHELIHHHPEFKVHFCRSLE